MPQNEIFIYTDLDDRLKDVVRANVNSVCFNDRADREGSLVRFRESTIVMGNPPPDWVSGKSNLQFWQLDSAGFDQYKNVVTDALVANMGDYFSMKCAETIVGGILAFYRRIPQLVKLQQSKTWMGKSLRYEMDMLTGKSVIILGAGTIAQSIKKLLSGFDCNIRFTGRKNPLAEIQSREELFNQLPSAQIVINTLPGSAGVYADKDIFERMNTGALYSSVGRGTTTDEAALISALHSGKLEGAVLDVTANEPLPISSPLWEMDNVLITQHTGGGYRFEDDGKVDVFLANLSNFRRGEPVRNRITLSEGY